MTADDPFATVHEKPRDMSMGDMFFSFDGRIKRQDWWLWSILVGIVGFVYAFIVGFFSVVFFGELFFSSEEMASEDFLLYEVNYLWATTVLIFLLPLWYVNLAITMKRLQDTGKSWEWGSLSILRYILSGASTYFPLESSGAVILSTLSLIVVIPVWIICGFFKGTDGPNDFGPDPLQSQSVASQNSFDNTPGVYNSVPSSTVPVNTSELKDLGELRDSGIITEVEFQEQKDKIFGNR